LNARLGSPTAPARRNSFRRLASYLRGSAGLFALSLAFMVVAALLDAFSLVLLIPFLRSLFGAATALPGSGANPAERLLNALLGEWLSGVTPLGALRVVCLVVLGAIVLKNLALYVARLCGIAVQERVERRMREQVYGHLTRLPLAVFSGQKAGQLLARVLTDTRAARAIVSYGLSDALRHAVTALAYLAALLAISWRLTLLTLALAPLLVAVIRPLIDRLRHGFRRALDEQGEMLSVLQETVSGIRLVKAFGAEAHERARFAEASSRYTRGMIRTEGTAELASPLSEVLSALVALALVWIGARMVLVTGSLGPEPFLAFTTIAVRLISPVKALALFPSRAQSSLAAADRFFEILDTRPEPGLAGEPAMRKRGAAAGDGERRDAVPVRAPPSVDSIIFEDVWFEYVPGHPVLCGIDLQVRSGEVIALVGPSGAGKSTLVDLLPRFIDPTRGRITLDGRDLRDFPLPALRSLFGIVSQETVIFHDGVRANIAYGEPGRWSPAEIEAAARAAHAHEFVCDLPGGYDAPLGDRGVRLSGGERQRIGIARALLRDPPILILDEATSALDAASERLVQEALARLMAGRMVFVIAHRPSTVRNADRILALEGGRILEVQAAGVGPGVER